jgi:endonuclease YncB( thermonuclease family)
MTRKLFYVAVLALAPLAAQAGDPQPCIGIASMSGVVDGDTLDIVLLSSRCGTEQAAATRPNVPLRVRLLGVDTPERGQEGFAEASDFTFTWAKANPIAIAFFSVSDNKIASDKYGRMLAVLSPANTDSTFEGLFASSLNALLVPKHAKTLSIKNANAQLDYLTNRVHYAILKHASKKSGQEADAKTQNKEPKNHVAD